MNGNLNALWVLVKGLKELYDNDLLGDAQGLFGDINFICDNVELAIKTDVRKDEEIDNLKRLNKSKTTHYVRQLAFLEAQNKVLLNEMVAQELRSPITFGIDFSADVLNEIKSDAIDSVTDKCPWHHDREFIKIDELIAYSEKVRKGEL